MAAVPGTHPVSAVGLSSGISLTDDFLVRNDWASYMGGFVHDSWADHENVTNASNIGEK